jgi:hypothetical protein
LELSTGVAIPLSFGKEMENCFEQRLTEGKATYFSAFNYVRETESFEAIIFHDPESPHNFRRLFVDSVVRFQATLHDTDNPPHIEGIIGVHQETKDGYVETRFHTDLREIAITSCEPIIIEKTEQAADGNAVEAV